MKRLVLMTMLAASLAGQASALAPPRRVQAPVTRFSIDTPIERLIANPAAKAALDRTMPGLSSNPNMAMFMKMSMRELAANPHASIPASRVQALQAELARIR